MIPDRPYLIRAYYDWIVDNGWTPYIAVYTSMQNVQVPIEYIKDDQIVLNVAMQAVQNFHISNEAVEFRARFGGVPRQIYVPIGSIVAIYARENGMGQQFPPEDFGGGGDGGSSTDGDKDNKNQGKKDKPKLTLVKK